jgi:hypothetical protein
MANKLPNINVVLETHSVEQFQKMVIIFDQALGFGEYAYNLFNLEIDYECSNLEGFSYPWGNDSIGIKWPELADVVGNWIIICDYDVPLAPFEYVRRQSSIAMPIRYFDFLARTDVPKLIKQLSGE